MTEAGEGLKNAQIFVTSFLNAHKLNVFSTFNKPIILDTYFTEV